MQYLNDPRLRGEQRRNFCREPRCSPVASRPDEQLPLEFHPSTDILQISCLRDRQFFLQISCLRDRQFQDLFISGHLLSEGL
jgi:hypothetical protein